jgi:hypothetical protein
MEMIVICNMEVFITYSANRPLICKLACGSDNQCWGLAIVSGISWGIPALYCSPESRRCRASSEQSFWRAQFGREVANQVLDISTALDCFDCHLPTQESDQNGSNDHTGDSYFSQIYCGTISPLASAEGFISLGFARVPVTALQDLVWRTN